MQSSWRGAAAAAGAGVAGCCFYCGYRALPQAQLPDLSDGKWVVSRNFDIDATADEQRRVLSAQLQRAATTAAAAAANTCSAAAHPHPAGMPRVGGRGGLEASPHLRQHPGGRVRLLLRL